MEVWLYETAEIMSDEYITLTCPQCHASVDYLKEFAGTTQPCPYCDDEIVIPAGDGQEAHTLSFPLETERLVLRRLENEDLQDIFAILSDPDIFQYEPDAALDEEGCQQWLERARRIKSTDVQGGVMLGITRRSDNKLIGLFSFWYAQSDRQQGAFKIQIHRDSQRKGFGTEALTAMLEFCFKNIGLHRMMATCDTRNEASVGLLKKVGMRREAECLQDRFINGEWSDSFWFAMLEEECRVKT